MTRQRLAPEERRTQIIAAARARAADAGLARTSLRDIAAAAGVSLGTVTYHFAGIDEILSAVVIREAEEFYSPAIARADAHPDPWQALAELIKPMFTDTPAVDAHWRIWAHYWAAIARHPGLADTYFHRIRHWEACCVRVIERGVAAGAFAPVDPRESALKMAAYSDGLATQRFQGVAALTYARAREWMHDFTRALLTPNPRPQTTSPDLGAQNTTG